MNYKKSKKCSRIKNINIIVIKTRGKYMVSDQFTAKKKIFFEKKKMRHQKVVT